MNDDGVMLWYWALLGLIVLAGIFGLWMAMVVRRSLRYWMEAGSEARQRARAGEQAGVADPWRESAQRLIVPMPHPEKDDDDSEANGESDAPDDDSDEPFPPR